MGGEGTPSHPKSPRSRRAKSVAADLNISSGSGSNGTGKKKRSKEGKAKISIPEDEINSNTAPTSPRTNKRKSKFRAATGGGSGSNRSLKDKDSIIPEDESFVPLDSPDMNWGTPAATKLNSNHNRKGECEGSSSTATTMDSSGGSIDSDGRGDRQRRKEKPDMDWGSHATKSISTNSGHKQRGGGGLGGKGSGHKPKGAKKKKDALSKGGSAHSGRVMAKPKTIRRSASGGSVLQVREDEESAVTPSIKTPKRSNNNNKKMDGRMSALLQVIAMDSSYQTDANGGRTRANMQMAKMVKLGEGLTDSSSEDEEEQEDEDDDENEIEDLFEEDDDDDDGEEEDDSSEEEQQPKQKMKKSPKKKRQKALRTRSNEDGRRRQSIKGSRSKGMKKSKTMDDATTKRYQREIAVPSTPKAGRKARAKSMMVSPKSDDEDQIKEKRKQRQRGHRASIHEMNGLVTPRRQSRKSISTDLGIMQPSSASRRQSRQPQQPALPLSLDLGYGNDDEESSRATNRKKGRRSSLGAGSALLGGDFLDGSRQRKEGNRRFQDGGLITSSRHMNDTLNGLITPRRSRPKLAVPSPFDPDYEEEEEEEEKKKDGLLVMSQSEVGDRTRTGRQQLGNRRGSQLLQGDDDAVEDEADDLMSQSERGRRGSTSRRRRDFSRRGSININLTAAMGDDDDDINNNNNTKNSMDLSSSRHRVGSRRSLIDNGNANNNTIDSMDLSSSRHRAGSRRSVMDNGASGRRPSRSLRGLDRLKGGGDDDDNIPEEDSRTIGVKSLPEQSSKSKRKSVRGRRRDAVDDEAVGRRTSISSSSSTARGGRYGYGGDQGRLCLSAVPSQPKKSVGLAALLYCKPLDLGGNDEKEDDDSKSMNQSAHNQEDGNKSGSPTSVLDDVEEEHNGDKQPMNKAKAKKDYWKAKLASGKSDSDRSLVVQ